jgi:hypothetical protein
MIPARFSTGTRDAYPHARNDLPAAGQAACFPPRAVMLHRLDEAADQIFRTEQY